MKKKSSLILSLILVVFIAPPVVAKDNRSSGARLERIERDLMLLQRQISRSPRGSSNSVSTTGNNADYEVRLSQVENQIRKLVGKTEENEFQARKLSENLDKLKRDTDFRFNELARTPTASNNSSTKPSPKQNTITNTRKVPNGNLDVNRDRDAMNNFNSSKSYNADETGLEKNFSSPREHYNYAFRLLNQTQYAKAAISFSDFIEEHPKDPLIGNAYYWRGETFYIRQNYAKAIDSFRQGFEEMPKGPKAPDNLLKLAMTLGALKRTKEACVVLSQVVVKFKRVSSAVSQKAKQERKRIRCK